jgi:hypothetical protein
MRTRTALIAAVGLLAAGGSLSPALAGPRAGVVKGSWTATASPDPTGENPVSGNQCDPTLPSGRTTHNFTVPGKGVLEVHLNNQLDWSGDLRDGSGEILGSADGGSPTTVEEFSVSFKKKTAVVIGACNLEGEPSVNVTWTFTPKKK